MSFIHLDIFHAQVGQATRARYRGCMRSRTLPALNYSQLAHTFGRTIPHAPLKYLRKGTDPLGILFNMGIITQLGKTHLIKWDLLVFLRK